MCTQWNKSWKAWMQTFSLAVKHTGPTSTQPTLGGQFKMFRIQQTPSTSSFGCFFQKNQCSQRSIPPVPPASVLGGCDRNRGYAKNYSSFTNLCGLSFLPRQGRTSRTDNQLTLQAKKALRLRVPEQQHHTGTREISGSTPARTRSLLPSAAERKGSRKGGGS